MMTSTSLFISQRNNGRTSEDGRGKANDADADKAEKLKEHRSPQSEGYNGEIDVVYCFVQAQALIEGGMYEKLSPSTKT